MVKSIWLDWLLGNCQQEGRMKASCWDHLELEMPAVVCCKARKNVWNQLYIIYIYYIIICFSLLPVTLTDWTSKTRSFVWRCLVHACLPGLQKDLHHWMALHQQRSQQPRSGETEASTWRILRAGKQFDPRVVPQPRFFFFFQNFTLWLWLTVCHGKIHHF